MLGSQRSQPAVLVGPSPIPPAALPVPVVQVSGFAPGQSVDEAELRAETEGCEGIEVASISFTHLVGIDCSRLAFVRLRPLESQPVCPSPTAAQEGGWPSLAQRDADSFAAEAVKRLSNKQPRLRLGGKSLTFALDERETVLFLGGLPAGWGNDDLAAYVEERYGKTWRVVVMTDSSGRSKQYGFVEFKAATDADRCLNELVARERQQKQTDGGSKKQALGAKASAGPSNTAAGSSRDDGTAELLLHAEKASLRRADRLHSRKLHVTIRPAGRSPEQLEQQLREDFGQHGKVETVHVPRDSRIKRPLAFAFVEMSTEVDAVKAFCALQSSAMSPSFANPTTYPSLWRPHKHKPAEERDAKKVRDGSKFAGQEELGEDGLDFVQTAKALAAAPRAAPEKASRRKRTKMKPPDPDAPTRPKSAWMFFMPRNHKRVRHELEQELERAGNSQNVSNAIIKAKLSEQWAEAKRGDQSLAEEYGECIRLEKEAKQRYDEELKLYRAKKESAEAATEKK